MTLPSSQTYARWLAFIRILTGVVWLIHAVPKFLNSAAFLPPNGAFAAYLARGIPATAGPYHDFLANVVSPNAALFAELVRFGELLIGISLVLGLFSRVGALFGVLLPLNYMAARAAMGTVNGWGSPDAMLALLSFISLVLPTSRIAGFDGLRTPRAARRPSVIAEVVPERPLDRPTAPPP